MRLVRADNVPVRDRINLIGDSDIHPWEITIDGETWPGRIRLIAFVDVFFIISYSSNDRFMKGVIIYSLPTL